MCPPRRPCRLCGIFPPRPRSNKPRPIASLDVCRGTGLAAGLPGNGARQLAILVGVFPPFLPVLVPRGPQAGPRPVSVAFFKLFLPVLAPHDRAEKGSPQTCATIRYPPLFLRPKPSPFGHIPVIRRKGGHRVHIGYIFLPEVVIFRQIDR
jgi:hypothetical protein